MVSAMDAETQLHETVNALNDAWNAHDAAAFAALFHDNADFTNVFGMTASGRDGIERFHAPLFTTIFRHTHFLAEATRIRFIREDVAFIDIHWKMTGAEDREREPWPDRQGLMTMVMTPRLGGWAIAIMHVIEFSRGHG
jgi:uncharacterized protein (TIGR02246 family)